jgi:glycosyltransferase involved in cell wall biosynthesis
MRLSVIIPVFNERATMQEVLRRVDAVDLEKEVIIVDDCSTDGTREVLRETRQNTHAVVFHDENLGKGAAFRTGLKYASGDYVIVQDADLEYDPKDYKSLLTQAEGHPGDVVYGSRFVGKRPAMSFRHWVGNKLLTGLTNILYGASLTDMETCYKLFPREVITGLRIQSNGFSVEPEITAKILKLGISIHEVPVSYIGRTFSEGKKISWRDFVSAGWILVKLRISN